MAGIVNKVWKIHRAPTQIEGLYALMFEFRWNVWEYGLKVHIIAIRCDEFLYKNKRTFYLKCWVLSFLQLKTTNYSDLKGFTSSFSALQFFAVVARMLNFLFSRFVEDVNTKQQFSFSLAEFWYSSRKIRHYLSNWARWNKRVKVWSSGNSLLPSLVLIKLPGININSANKVP